MPRLIIAATPKPKLRRVSFGLLQAIKCKASGLKLARSSVCRLTEYGCGSVFIFAPLRCVVAAKQCVVAATQCVVAATQCVVTALRQVAALREMDVTAEEGPEADAEKEVRMINRVGRCTQPIFFSCISQVTR